MIVDEIMNVVEQVVHQWYLYYHSLVKYGHFLSSFPFLLNERNTKSNEIKSSREKQRNDYSNIDEENEFLFHFFHLLYMPNGRIEMKKEENKDMIHPLGLGPGSIS